jgi:hypothetical protein
MAQSRITRHYDLLPGVKGNTKHARRFRDLILGFISDMGGIDVTSDVRLALLRRLAAVTVCAEKIEARMINGEQIDIGTLCTLASTSVRIAQRVGLDRIPREVNQTLHEYLLEHHAEVAEHEATIEATAEAAE